MSRQDRFSWFASKNSKASKQHRQRRTKPSIARGMGLARSLHVEALEDRCMLAVITVTSLADNTFPGGGVTLREAIQAANTDTSVDGSVAGDGADAILFDAALSDQTIDLGGELGITEALTIDATSLAANVTIDANNASRIFDITTTTGDFTLAGLTLTGGKTTDSSFSGNAFSGGAIRSLTSGRLTIDQSTVSGNSTEGGTARGGGIFSLDAVTLTSSTVTGNRAEYMNSTGGGIWNYNDSITITNSIVTDNTAGGGSPDIDPGTGTFTVNFSLLAGSPGIDAGDPAAIAGVGDTPLSDQRGVGFDRVRLGRIDIGAFESSNGTNVNGTWSLFVIDDAGGDPGEITAGWTLSIAVLQQTTPVSSADFDSDGDIDGADFLAWQRGFGTPAPNASPADGDANDDQTVDAADLAVWEGQFGGPAPLAAASTASASASISIEEPLPIESVATLATLFVELVAPATLPANLMDAALATEWLGVMSEEKTPASPRREVAFEAAFAASLAADRLASEGEILAEFGTSNAKSEEVKVEEGHSDLPWLSGELLERVFG